MSTKQHPQRTCIACREKKEKRDLIRIVATETGLDVDKTGKKNGRGAYVCDDPACWERAISQSILSKALRAEITDDDRNYLRQILPS